MFVCSGLALSSYVGYFLCEHLNNCVDVRIKTNAFLWEFCALESPSLLSWDVAAFWSVFQMCEMPDPHGGA